MTNALMEFVRNKTIVEIKRMTSQDTEHVHGLKNNAQTSVYACVNNLNNRQQMRNDRECIRSYY